MTAFEINKLKNKIILEETILKKVKSKLRQLHPIDIQSTTGVNLRQERDEIKGKLIAYKWVLNGMKND